MSPQSPGEAPGHHADSFEAFYLATAQHTFDLVRRAVAGDKHAGHDLTQDAYMAMLGRWDERRRHTTEDNRRYVVGIAMHKVADWYRMRGRLVELEREHDYGGEDSAIAELLDELAVLQGVRDLIDAQPARRRLVAVMFFLQGLEPTEIAEVLGITASTVRTHIQRLRDLLKPYIDKISELDAGGERP